MHNRSSSSLVQAVQSAHVLTIQVETEDVGVCLDTSRVVALWQRNPIFLETESDQHLVWRDTVLLGDLDECLIVCLCIANQGTVCLNGNVVLLAVCDNFLLL